MLFLFIIIIFSHGAVSPPPSPTYVPIRGCIFTRQQVNLLDILQKPKTCCRRQCTAKYPPTDTFKQIKIVCNWPVFVVGTSYSLYVEKFYRLRRLTCRVEVKVVMNKSGYRIF